MVPDRPLQAHRYLDPQSWIERTVHRPLVVPEYGPLGSRTNEAKQFALRQPHSLLRGQYPTRQAAGASPRRIHWLILDLDAGMTKKLRRKLKPYLRIEWTTISHCSESERLRVAIPLRRPTTQQGHDLLRQEFLGDYGGAHHDDLHRVALLPIQRVAEDDSKAEVRVTGYVGEFLRPRHVAQPLKLAASNTEPLPKETYRLAQAIRANLGPVCRLLRIRIADRIGHGSRMAIHCPFDKHEDKTPSASIAFTEKGDAWVNCHGHPDVDGTLSEPLVDFYWKRFFRPPSVKHLVPTKAQRLLYGARMLHHAQAHDRPDVSFWQGDSNRLIDIAVRDLGAVVELPDHAKPRLRVPLDGGDLVLNLETIHKAFNGTRLLFACHKWVHGSLAASLAAKFLSEWCGLSRNGDTYAKARKLFLLLGLIKEVGIVQTSSLRPSVRNQRLTGRPKPTHDLQLYAPCHFE
jgi:hypothetical protein